MRQFISLVLLTLVSAFMTHCNFGDEGSGSVDTDAISTVQDDDFQGSGSSHYLSIRRIGNGRGSMTWEKYTDMNVSTGEGSDRRFRIEGYVRSFASKFMRFYPETTTGDDASDVDSPSYDGFSIRSVASFWEPPDGSNKIIFAPSYSRTCRDFSEKKYNFLRMNGGNAANILTGGRKRWGNVTFPAHTGSGPVDLTGYKWDIDGNMTNNVRTFMAASRCSGGLMRTRKDKNNGETNYGYIRRTSSGVAFADPKVNDDDDDRKELKMVFVEQDSAVTSSTLNNKTFVGVMFRNRNAKTWNSVEIVFDGSGRGALRLVDDVENPRTGADEGYLNVNYAGSGEMTGMIHFNTTSDQFSGNGKMWAAVKTNIGGSGAVFLIANGVWDPSNSRGATIIAVQKE